MVGLNEDDTFPVDAFFDIRPFLVENAEIGARPSISSLEFSSGMNLNDEKLIKMHFCTLEIKNTCLTTCANNM